MPPRKLISFDWAMKKILRQKANFVILEGFLTELLKFDVKIIEILESEANQESEDDKFNRVDLLAKNESGELILIEVQYNDEIDYFHRMLYGTAKLITQYIQKGKGYAKVKKVYSINIVYFEIGQGGDYVYHGKTEFKGLHTDDILMPSDIQKREFNINTISDIYPEYYILRINQFNDIAKNTLDEWIYFLKNEEIKTDFKAKGLNEAKEVLDVLKLDPTEREIYERKEENRRYKESLLYTAEKKGVERGIKRGEKRKAIEIAKNLLLANIDIETVIESTGLTAKEIEELNT
jgi:predicted transposase/invertase (TIGR01784 family)